MEIIKDIIVSYRSCKNLQGCVHSMPDEQNETRRNILEGCQPTISSGRLGYFESHEISPWY